MKSVVEDGGGEGEEDGEEEGGDGEREGDGEAEEEEEGMQGGLRARGERRWRGWRWRWMWMVWRGRKRGGVWGGGGLGDERGGVEGMVMGEVRLDRRMRVNFFLFFLGSFFKDRKGQGRDRDSL